MRSRPDSVEVELRRLQQLVRQTRRSEGPLTYTGNVPDDLIRPGLRSIALYADEREALARTRASAAIDLRYEHLPADQVQAATWRFVCLAHIDPHTDHAKQFETAHAQEPVTTRCFTEVALLSLDGSFNLADAEFMRAEDAPIPPSPFVKPEANAAVIAVDISGTNRARMRDRAHAHSRHALRVLRAALREDPWIHDDQLRFRLGALSWFDDGGWAFRGESDFSIPLDLASAAFERVKDQPLLSVPFRPSTDLERRLTLALAWFERSQLIDDSTTELLYLFFALEAILGDRSEKLKAPALALRRAVLGLESTGGYRHPSSTYLLYDNVRSAAVHGELAPEVPRRDLDSFAMDVRRALNEYLAFATRHRFTKRAQVRKALDRAQCRDEVLRRLLAEDPRTWRRVAADVRSDPSIAAGTAVAP
jgi:hypothetical protein